VIIDDLNSISLAVAPYITQYVISEPGRNFSMAGFYINVWTNLSGMCLDANHQLVTHGLQGRLPVAQALTGDADPVVGGFAYVEDICIGV